MAAPVKHSGLVDYTSYSSDTVEPLGEVEKKMVDFLKEKLPEINACLSGMKAIETKRSEIQARQEQVGREYAATVQILAEAEAAILVAGQEKAKLEAELAAIQAREAEIQAREAEIQALEDEAMKVLKGGISKRFNGIFKSEIQLPNLDGYILPDSFSLKKIDGKSTLWIDNMDSIIGVLLDHGANIQSINISQFKANVTGTPALVEYLKANDPEKKILVVLHNDVSDEVKMSLADIRTKYLKPKA